MDILSIQSFLSIHVPFSQYMDHLLHSWTILSGQRTSSPDRDHTLNTWTILFVHWLSSLHMQRPLCTWAILYIQESLFLFMDHPLYTGTSFSIPWLHPLFTLTVLCMKRIWAEYDIWKLFSLNLFAWIKKLNLEHITWVNKDHSLLKAEVVSP